MSILGGALPPSDTIGTPLCIIVDHQTLQGSTMTVRYRDSMAQERLPIDNVGGVVKEQTNIATLLRKL